MSVTAHVYTKNLLALATKKLDLTTDSLKVMLLQAYTIGATQDTAEFLADVLAVATEAAGTGYVAGGQLLTSVTLTESGHVYTLTCANPQWDATGGSLAASHAVFFDATPGSNATNPVLCFWDFGGTLTDTGGLFKLTVNASGLLTWTSA